eukprot:g3021.t1
MPQWRSVAPLGWLVPVSLSMLVLGLVHHDARAAADGSEAWASLGSRECPLDISVLWTAEVDSPVYSTPVILPASGDGRKQIVLATLRNVELLEGDGSAPYPWPIEMDDHDNAAFLASPSLHDVDGDGVQDICVADTMGWVRWLTPKDGASTLPYLPDHRQYLPYRTWLRRLQETEAGSIDGLSRRRGRRRLSDAREVDRVATQGDGQEGSGGEMDVDEEGHVALAGDSYAEAYAEAMHQWGEYGTGPFLGDDGTGWLADYDYYHNWRHNVDDGVLEVEPHISAAPVFFDVDVGGGGPGKRMVLSVSYFFTSARGDDDDDARKESAGAPDADEYKQKFVAGALACWDFEALEWSWTYDLGQADSGEMERGAYVDASPTVGDLDGDGRLEVLVGTVSGGLHVIDALSGAAREGFPVTYDEIRGQVTIADVNRDGQLEMLLADSSGTVACVRHDGTERWNKRLEGSVLHTLTLGDIDGDGTLDVVVAVTTVEGAGEVWALNAENGLLLANSPVKLGNRKGISAPITLVDLHQKSAGSTGGAVTVETYGQTQGRGPAPIGGRGRGIHLLAPSEDGHVYVIEGQTGCVNKIDLGERVRSMVLADDVDGDGTLDLVVGTMSGEVVALSTNVPFHPLNAWTSQVRGPLNGFTHGGYQGVYFVGASDYDEMVGRHFALTFEIVDAPEARKGRGDDGVNAEGHAGTKPYQIFVFAGTEEIFRRDYAHPGRKTEAISLKAPRRALLRIQMTTSPQSLAFEDHVFVGYNTRFHVALKWMIVGPVVLAALPFLWSDGGFLGSRVSLPG